MDARFAGMGDEQEVASGRSLRVRKVVKPCPTCKTDIGDFLRTAQVNRCEQSANTHTHTLHTHKPRHTTLHTRTRTLPKR